MQICKIQGAYLVKIKMRKSRKCESLHVLFLNFFMFFFALYSFSFFFLSPANSPLPRVNSSLWKTSEHADLISESGAVPESSFLTDAFSHCFV